MTREAIKWYRKAAQQGYAIAQDNLGWMSKWQRCPQDDVEAVKWYRKAAEGGNLAKAQDNLGWMYQHGRGVPARTMQRQSGGFAKPLRVAIPQPKIILTGCIKTAGALKEGNRLCKYSESYLKHFQMQNLY